jgi:hypothetical protein
VRHCINFGIARICVEYAGGRGKLFATREIGIHTSKRVPSAVPALTNLGTQNVQSRSAPSLPKCHIFSDVTVHESC